jgi:murein L,D-transpeptidase YcbB/YkuD
MTQTEVLEYIKRLYDAGCVRLSGAHRMDQAIFETNLQEAIALGDSPDLLRQRDELREALAAMLRQADNAPTTVDVWFQESDAYKQARAALDRSQSPA